MAILSQTVIISTITICLLIGLNIILTSVALANTTTTNNELAQLIPAPEFLEGTCDVGLDQARRKKSYTNRVTVAFEQYTKAVPCHPNNGDEALFPVTRAGSYSKGLPHDSLGHVNSAAYNLMLTAVSTGLSTDWDAVPLAVNATRKLDNPQAGNAFALEGSDSRVFAQVPPPTFSSAAQAAEVCENYWMALLRDVNFDEYSSNGLAAAAVIDLNNMTDFNGLTPVTPANLFRGNCTGCTVGPYVSQFLYMPCPFGANTIDQRMLPPTSGLDFMTTWADYLNVQQGRTPLETATFGTTPLYIRNGRDLAGWVSEYVYKLYCFNLILLRFTLTSCIKPTFMPCLS